MRILYILLQSVGCVSGYITGIWMLLKYHKLVEFWQHLTAAITVAHSNLNVSDVSLRRKILVVAVFAFILWLVPIAELIVIYSYMSMVYYAASQENYYPDETFDVLYVAVIGNYKIANVIYMIFGFMFLAYPLPLLLACNSLYCVVCLLLTSLLETTGKDGRSLLAIQRRHDEICKLVVDADDIFGDIVAVWYFFEILALVFNFRSAVEFWRTSIRGTNIVVATFILAFSKTLLSSKVNSLVRDSLFNPFLRNILTMEDNEVEVEIYSLYCSSISLNMPGLTAWKFFHVNRGFIVTVIGAIVTYSVIMFDL